MLPTHGDAIDDPNLAVRDPSATQNFRLMPVSEIPQMRSNTFLCFKE
jgi:hypothetical protein